MLEKQTQRGALTFPGSHGSGSAGFGGSEEPTNPFSAMLCRGQDPLRETGPDACRAAHPPQSPALPLLLVRWLLHGSCMTCHPVREIRLCHLGSCRFFFILAPSVAGRCSVRICLRFSGGVIRDLGDLWGPVSGAPILTAGWCPSAVAGMSRASSSLAWAQLEQRGMARPCPRLRDGSSRLPV